MAQCGTCTCTSIPHIHIYIYVCMYVIINMYVGVFVHTSVFIVIQSVLLLLFLLLLSHIIITHYYHVLSCWLKISSPKSFYPNLQRWNIAHMVQLDSIHVCQIEKVEGLVGSHMTPLLINRLWEPTGNQQARVDMFSDLGGENSGQKKRYPRVNQRRCGKPMVSDKIFYKRLIFHIYVSFP